jgi:HlyD family secretion protein
MNYQPVPDRHEIERALGLGGGAKARRTLGRLFWIGLLVLLAAGGLWWWQSRQQAANAITYETEQAVAGPLTVTVTATGTLQPTTQVDVSSEMSGIVRSVKVDDNSLVRQGDVLAELDTERYAAQLQSLSASLEGAKAKLADAEASLTAANLTLERQRTLQKRGLSPTQERDNALASQLRAEAAVSAAKAEIDIANSNLALKKLDIDKSSIRSPINGIVLKRAAEPGQTVASSLQAPVLFTLAEDLTRMQLEADIDEADIGTVKVGQKASFTVDAYGGRNFDAIIQSIQFSPKTENGVVTYKAVLTVDNADLSLRPGMTATARIVTEEIANALLVPNAALRYNPPAARSSEGFNISRIFMPRMPSSRTQPKQVSADERKVWTLKDNAPQSVSVKTGATDGQMTVVTEGSVEAGMALIISSRQGGAQK